ncbi:MAG: hypothetical protein KA250_13935 [Verrucomicrobiales bacterium]|jgi:hypothetical protein|nr:hypothetical protein [Verrucomicrobiales bacterium]MBP9224368.1 hypothetical protein [Verrucomicrobiales bacterium]HQZ29317.1 hypothetical protein [Verrucomicrobiales bacterium]
MPRRASSGINIGQIAGIAAAILGFVVIAALLFKLIAGGLLSGSGGKSSGKRTSANATQLNLSTYRTNGNSLRGNVYRVEGRVEETLRWTPDRGRLISFEADDATETMPVPILVPEDFSNVNIERGNQMAMVVRVDRDGTLVAETIEN